MATWTEELIERLPPLSAAKIRALIEQRDAAYAVLRAASDAAQDARQRHDQTENDARRRLAMAQDGDDVERILAPVAPRRSELERANAAKARAEAAWQKFSNVSACAEWAAIYFQNGGRLSDADLPKVNLAKGETFQSAVESIRSEIETVAEDWRSVEAAPMPLDDLKADITASVDAIAAKGVPGLDPRSRTGDPARLNSAIRLTTHGGSLVGDGGAALLVWACRDVLVDKLYKLAEQSDFTNALTDDARDARFSELLDRKLDLEFREEVLIVAAAAEGMTIDRRPDADPRAVLQVRETFAEDENVRIDAIPADDESDEITAEDEQFAEKLSRRFRGHGRHAQGAA